MTSQYSRNVLKVVVAQICQTIGWHSIHTTPLEFMVDLMQEYIFQVAKISQQYAQVLGRCEVNLDDLGLAFQQMNIDLPELAEYIKNVEPVPCALSVPKLPVHRDSHLNFLKPGSREVVTRPVHVHEHLPAMYPAAEEEYNKTEAAKEQEATETNPANQVTNQSEDESSENNNVITSNGPSNEEGSTKAGTQSVFKRPGDPVSFDGPIGKRAKLTEEGRPLREIHSVIMTTSGYLSTAREGKLPEARTPQQARQESPPPPPKPPTPPMPTPSQYPMVPPEVKVEKKTKKITKKTEDGKPENKENKKKKILKDTLFQPDEIVKDVKVKKLAGPKDIAKLKALKSGAKAAGQNLAGPSNIPVSGKIPGVSPKHAKNNANKIKAEKFDNLSSLGNPLLNDCKEELPIDKLPVEPNKQKLNIFKKISSKSKEDKERDSLDFQHKLKDSGSRDDFGHLTTDDERRADSIKQEDRKPMSSQNPLMNNNVSRGPEDNVNDMMSPGSDGYMFDMSPTELRTPSTPKTPELSMPSSAVGFEQSKKKRKEKSGKKKEPKVKTPKNTANAKKARLSNDSMSDLHMLDRPKTPQAPEQPQPIAPPPAVGPREPGLPSTLPFPFFSPFPTAPGLIPHPMFPLPLAAKGLAGMPAIPGAPNPAAAMMLGQRFFRPKLDGSRPPLVPPSFMGADPHLLQQQQLPLPPQSFPLKQPMQQLDKSRISRSPEKEALSKSTVPPFLGSSELLSQSLSVNQPPVMSGISAAAVPAPLVPPAIPPVVPAPLLPPAVVKPPKSEKDKSEKKSKEHKKEKKDKLKKKKEKKEKHKDKGEKIKEKKDKSEKKDKLEKLKEKKEKKEKRKEKELNKKIAKEEKTVESVPKILLKLGPSGGSPRPPTPDSALTKKITIKPPKKPEDEVVKREPSPELARISPLVTRPPKQKSKAKADAVAKKDGTKEDKENGVLALTAKTVDASGRTVWICPACGKQDDGSPMIGCDDCDAWYHWECVGIQVPPATNEDWYCRMCIVKKQEQYQDKKKKKRKKKMKVSA